MTGGVFYHATTIANLRELALGVSGVGQSDNPLQCIWMYDSPHPARQFALITLANRRPGAKLWMYQLRLHGEAVVADTLSPGDLAGPRAAALEKACLPWWRRWVWRGTWPEALCRDLERRDIVGYQNRKNAMFQRLRDAGVHALRNCEIAWVAGSVRHYRDDYGETTTVLLDQSVARITHCERL